MALFQETTFSHQFLKLLPVFIFLQSILKRSIHGKELSFEITYRIYEELPPLTLVGNIKKDARLSEKLDNDILNEVTFKFLYTNSTAVKYFLVEEETGVLKTSYLRLDRDSEDLCRRKDACQLSIDVALHPHNYFRLIKVRVDLIDLNDNSPMFRESHVNISINEASPIGSTYSLPAAYDNDSPKYGIQRYEVDKAFEKLSMVFSESVSGQLEAKLVLKMSLDREEQSMYQMILKAIDQGSDKHASMTGIAVVNIIVADYNDNKPIFTEKKYNVFVKEDLPLNSVLETVRAYDADDGLNGQVQYQFTAETAKVQGHTFGMKNDTGDLILINHLDREKTSIHQLRVVAKDMGEESLSSVAEVVVMVQDVNDNYPHITITFFENNFQKKVKNQVSKVLIKGDKKDQSRLLSTEVREDAPLGSFVGHVKVVDNDEQEAGEVMCFSKDHGIPYKLVNSSFKKEYNIILQEKLDREKREIYYMPLNCVDKGSPALSSEIILRFHTGDINDNAPIFEQSVYKAVLRENNFRDEDILQIFAEDLDSGKNGQIDYSLSDEVSQYFQIDQRGVISAIEEIDREEVNSFEFNAIATDRGQIKKSSTATIYINIDDSNDEKPLFDKLLYEFSLMENSPIGSVVGTVHAIDKDSSKFNTFTYQLNLYNINYDQSSYSDYSDYYFSLESNTGKITSKRSFDREQQDQYKFSIKAIDDHIPQMSSTVMVICTILDQNDNKPIFTFPTAFNNTLRISDKTPVGYTIKKITAHDHDSGANGAITYKILNNDNPPFSINVDNGDLKVTRDLSEFNQKIIELSIEASDMGDSPHSVKSLLKVQINNSIPFISTSARHHRGNLLSSISGAYTLILVIAISSLLFLVIISSLVCIVLFKQHRKKKRIKHKPGLSFISCDKGYELTANSPLEANSKTSNSSPSMPCKLRWNKQQTPTHESLFKGAVVQPVSNSLLKFNKKYQLLALQSNSDPTKKGQLSNGHMKDLKTSNTTSPLPPPPPPRNLHWTKSLSRTPSEGFSKNDETRHEKILNPYSKSPKKIENCCQQEKHAHYPNHFSSTDQLPTQETCQLPSSKPQQLWQHRTKSFSNKNTDFTPVETIINNSKEGKYSNKSSIVQSNVNLTTSTLNTNSKFSKNNTTEKKVAFNLNNSPFHLKNSFTSEHCKNEAKTTQNQLLTHSNLTIQVTEKSPQKSQFEFPSNQSEEQNKCNSYHYNTFCTAKTCFKKNFEFLKQEKDKKEADAAENGDSGIGGADDSGIGGADDSGIGGADDSGIGGADDKNESVDALIKIGMNKDKENDEINGCLACSCETNTDVSLNLKSKIREVSV